MIHKDALIGGGNSSVYINNNLMHQDGNDFGSDRDSYQSPPVDNSLYGEMDSPEDLLTTIESADLLQLSPQDATLDTNEEAFHITVRNEIIRQTNTFPTLEQHDAANCEFDLSINPNNTGKGGLYYSPELKKLFIKMEHPIYMTASFKYKPETKNVNIRAMMVFTEDISAPVKRCNNHKGNIAGIANEAEMESVIRSENDGVTYQGVPTGKNVNDRLSILIPLSSNDGINLRHSIALKFLCQNSCIGRKPTCVIFTLESTRGEELSKQVLNVKVCSCPKRDKDKEEKSINDMKRSASDIDCPPGKRFAKNMKIKEEPDVSPISPPQQEIESTLQEGVPLTLTLPDLATAKFVLTCTKAYLEASKSTPSNDDYLKNINKQLEEVEIKIRNMN